MPEIREFRPVAEEVQVGDVYAGHVVATIGVGSRWVFARNELDRRIFRLERGTVVVVQRSVETDDERVAREAREAVEQEARRTAWLADQSAEALASMGRRYDRAVAAVRASFDAGRVPDHGEVSTLYAGQRFAQHAARLTKGREVHPDTPLYDLFVMLRDDLVQQVLRSSVARWSGGFTISNAQEQLWRDVDLDVIRAVDTGFMHAL